MKTIPLLIGFFALFHAACAYADAVVLKDGTRVEGTLVEVTKQTVKIKVKGRLKSFDRSEVGEIFKGDRKIENPCPVCKASGKVVCNVCSGTKKSPGSCMKCGGEGHFECKKCEGTGKLKCEFCKGTGKRTIMVNQGLRFKKKVVDCSACNGYGWIYCSTCKKKGFIDCRKCKGTGRGPCDACKSSSTRTCPYCGGEGDKADAPEILAMKFTEIKKVLDDEKKTASEKKEFLDGLMGKRVFWPAVLVESNEESNRLSARLNLDESNVKKVKSGKGWEREEYKADLQVFFRPSESEKFDLLSKGSRFWVLGVLFKSQEGKPILLKAEIYASGRPEGASGK